MSEIINAESGFCPECDNHTIYKQRKDEVWFCFRCEKTTDEIFQKKAVLHRINDNDPDHIPDGHRMRDPRYPKDMTGEQLEKMYEEGVKAKRKMRQELGSSEHGRLNLSMPPELFHGKRKLDPHYWQDPKNVAKHRERWGV